MQSYDRSTPGKRVTRTTLNHPLWGYKSVVSHDDWLKRRILTVQYDEVSPTPPPYVRPTGQAFLGESRVYPRGVRHVTTWPWGKAYPQTSVTTGPFALVVPLPDITAVPQDLVDQAYNAALEKMYEKIRQSSLNLAVDLAEGKQLLQMILDLKKWSKRLLKNLRKDLLGGTGRETLDMLSKIPSRWLGYNFGLLPTVYSALELSTFFYLKSGELTLHPSKSTKHGIGRETIPRSADDTIPERLVKSQWSALSEFGCTYKIVDAELFNQSRLTSLSPVGIAWELTTLSWLVDYFIDIGGYLSLLEASAARGLAFSYGYHTAGSKATLELTVDDGYLSANGGSRYVWNLAGNRIKFTKTRSVLTEFPRPVFPSLQVDLNARRLSYITALLKK